MLNLFNKCILLANGYFYHFLFSIFHFPHFMFSTFRELTSYGIARLTSSNLSHIMSLQLVTLKICLPLKPITASLKTLFFPSTIIEWNKLDSNIRYSPSYKLFRKRIPEFIRPQPNSIFNAPNSLGLTYLTRLRVGLSHLCEHKFCHNLQDLLNPICSCGNAIEWTIHYLLHCSNFKNERQTLLQNVRTINPNLLSINEDALTHLLLYGNNTLTDKTNTFLLNSVIEYITSTKRFNDPLIL